MHLLYFACFFDVLVRSACYAYIVEKLRVAPYCYNLAKRPGYHRTEESGVARVASFLQAFPGSEGGYLYAYPNSIPYCACPTCGDQVDQDWSGLAQTCGCLAYPFGRAHRQLRGDLDLHRDAIGLCFFASAIRTEQAEDFTASNAKTDARDRLARPK